MTEIERLSAEIEHLRARFKIFTKIAMGTFNNEQLDRLQAEILKQNEREWEEYMGEDL